MKPQYECPHCSTEVGVIYWCGKIVSKDRRCRHGINRGHNFLVCSLCGREVLPRRYSDEVEEDYAI